MKDIAAHFGVSVATVSRALKNSPNISVEQRLKIQAYARQMHFVPNVVAEDLRFTRTKPRRLIGVIVPQVAHYYFSTILSGIESQASARGYQMIVAQSGEEYERERLLCQRFYEAKVCGVIVSMAKNTTDYTHFQHLIDRGVPIVFYDRICPGVEASLVVVDDYNGAFRAVSHMIDTGCRRVAFYGMGARLEIQKNRYNGYRDALLRRGIQPDPRLAIECDCREMAERITPSLMEQWRAEGCQPDAFFAVNDDTAIGILYTAKRLGFRVPDDISVCGFTNGERAIACEPKLTTVEQQGDMVGREAVDVLLRSVESGPAAAASPARVEKRVVRTRLITRGTTRQI